MINHILLAPYYIILKLRHFLYDSGIRKVHGSPVPTIAIGNVTVGGTGKTPHTEMLIRLLQDRNGQNMRNIAVLSRGYRRKSKGFQQVTADGTSAEYGDEPMQIKRKFPDVTVAVDKNRVEGCSFLASPDKLVSSKKARKCKNKDIKPQDLIILDDALQYRALKPTVSIVLASHSRPVYEDHLIPAGKLRDLPERVNASDIIIMTKCPFYLDEWEKGRLAASLRLHGYDPHNSTAITADGKQKHLFFTGIRYCQPEAVFPEGDYRYTYAKKAIMVTGIADDTPLARYLSDSYKIIRRISFPDHHSFTKADIRTIAKAAEENPTAVIVTTEKDSQRFLDCKGIPSALRQRMFRIPIRVDFLSEEEKASFVSALESLLPEYHSVH